MYHFTVKKNKNNEGQSESVGILSNDHHLPEIFYCHIKMCKSYISNKATHFLKPCPNCLSVKGGRLWGRDNAIQ